MLVDLSSVPLFRVMLIPREFGQIITQSRSSSWRVVSILLWRLPKRLSLFHRSICVSTVMTKGRIPDRWEEYAPVGKVIPGTRFIAFKVPLNPMLSRSLPYGTKGFLPEDLPAAIREQDRELGIVIDLTNTSRYYRKEDIVNQGIEYEKIFTEGHSVPSRDVQNCFFQAVDDFLTSNMDNDRVIGVHCTHGLNRTGYLVCRYMIDRMNFKADDAIKAFNEARGHDMERPNYLSDLRGESSSDVPSPDEDRRIERKRAASANEGSEGTAAAPHAEGKLRCLRQTPTTYDSQTSFTRQSGAGNDGWQGRSGSQSGQNSRSHYGNWDCQSRNYHSDYRQNYWHDSGSYDRRDYEDDWYDYDFARQPHGYDRQGYNVDLQYGGSWRQPRGYDRYDYADQHDFASNDLLNPWDFSGPSFQPYHGRSHGSQFQGCEQRNRRLENGRNYAAGGRAYYDDRHYQHSDSRQWRGNNRS